MPRPRRPFAFLSAILIVSFLATSASALSSVELVWSNNSSASSPSVIAVSASNIVTANIVLHGDAVGIAGVFVSIQFDPVELYAFNAHEHFTGNTGPGSGTSFGPVGPGVVIDNSAGWITNFDSAAGPPFVGCVNCTVTLGSVQFHAWGIWNGGVNDVDVNLAVLPNGVDAIVLPSGAQVDVPLGQLSVDDGCRAHCGSWDGPYPPGLISGVPEPGAVTLFALGALCVALIMRRGR
ncbi:MAG: hypothetical protein VX246_11950 [Myxococcota bacterium]|nr:hypothetical protein [Myxococcota bacterium]